jgi:hypothetical protein
MSIHSDVDLLCLYRDHVTPYVKAVASGSRPGSGTRR